MFKTKKEAENYRYGVSTWNIQGDKYNPDKCAYAILHNFFMITKQCNRKNGHGIEKLYCKQHAEIIKRKNKWLKI